jgi:hypothetical protein
MSQAAKKPDPVEERGKGGFRLTDAQHRTVWIGAVVVFVGLVMRLRFGGAIELPPRPPRPEMSAAELRALAGEVGASEDVWRGHLQRDSQRLGVHPVATAEQLSAVFRHQLATPGTVLAPEGQRSLEVAGLRLAVTVRESSGHGKAQLLLTAENPGQTALAYRIDTVPTHGTQPCHQKRDEVHNALAIAAQSSETRSECTYRKGWGIRVERVETIELPELSYIYVSMLTPLAIGLDARTTRSHRPVGGVKACPVVLSGTVRRRIETGETGWRDLVDFYARHPCHTYHFPNDYKALNAIGERRLPAVGAP